MSLANPAFRDESVELRLPDSDQSISYVCAEVHSCGIQNDTPLDIEIQAANLQVPSTSDKEPALDESLVTDDAHSPLETHHSIDHFAVSRRIWNYNYGHRRTQI